MSTIKINTTNLRGELAPLYQRYPGQTNPQPAYIQIDEDGNVSAGYSGETGNAVPSTVWHRRTLQWPVQPSVRGDVLADFLDSPEIVALLERVHAGHQVEWDGNNHVGRLNDDAQAAAFEIESAIYSADDCVSVWDTAEWLFNLGSLADHWSGQPLATAVAEIEAVAINEAVYLNDDVEDALLDEAGRVYDRHPERLNRVHVDALHAAGHINAAQVAEWIEDFGG